MSRRQKKKRNSPQTIGEPTTPTFLDHARELQVRLFAVVLAFLVVAGLAYPFFDKIVDVIMAPLDSSQELVYLTPAGAFSFIIKVCFYVGILGALPAIIYHLYQFLMPAVRKVRLRSVLGYTLASLFLAVAGVLFAYFVSLPAGLHFLTSFDLYHINPMLTIDSYFSFVMTYLLVGGLMFQLPLIMLIINTATPLTPKKLMGAQRSIIIGSFIVAAVVSPTPDALNQVLLAAPMVVMYQIGIMLVWIRNRKKKVASRDATREVIEREVIDIVPVEQPVPMPAPVLPRPPMLSSDGMIRSRSPRPIALTATPRQDVLNAYARSRPSAPTVSRVVAPQRRSIDGFFV